MQMCYLGRYLNFLLIISFTHACSEIDSAYIFLLWKLSFFFFILDR